MFTACSNSTGNGTGTIHRNVEETSTRGDFIGYEEKLVEEGIAFEKTELLEDAAKNGAIAAARYTFETGVFEIFEFYSGESELKEAAYNRTILRANGEEVPIVIMDDLAVAMYGFDNTKDLTDMVKIMRRQWPTLI